MDRVVLDKSADGKYWTLDGWITDDTVLRMRVEHSCYEDPSQVQAEVGFWNEAEQAVIWQPVGGEFLFALGTPDFEPESDWVGDFPEVFRDEFVELGHVLGHVAQRLDLGPALGSLVTQ